MTKMTPEEMERADETFFKHWRAWGNWYGWGSPVGLGIFILCLAGAIWIIAQLF